MEFYPDCKFGKFINFGLGTFESQRVNESNDNVSQLMHHL